MKTPPFLALLALLAAPPPSPAQQCRPLDGPTRARVLAYAQSPYGNIAAAPLQIADAALDAATCIYALTFTTSPPAEPLRRQLFLFPDRRYLTTPIYDLHAPLGTRAAFLNRGFDAFLRQHHIPTLGATGATVLVTVFGDYQCARCAALARMLRDELVPSLNQRVRVAFLNHPSTRHHWAQTAAQTAAQAAACAATQTDAAYWAIHNFLIENQDQLSAQNLAPGLDNFVPSIPGLDANALRACIASQETKPEIGAESSLALSSGVTTRPTLFLNGYNWTGPATADQLRQTIARLPGEAATQRVRDIEVTVRPLGGPPSSSRSDRSGERSSVPGWRWRP
jgi:protein-disulfide isomerase